MGKEIYKKIKASDVIYEKFSEDASEIYVIPLLQRPYSWDTKQVDKLWNDILENDHYYYIGNIVAISSQGTAGKDQIVDGQQRLTTLSLFLIAIRNYIRDSKSGKLVKMRSKIQKLLIKPERGNRLSFLNENSNKIYSALVEGKETGELETDTQKRFIKNLEHIECLLHKYSPDVSVSKISSLLEKIEKLQVIFTKCSDGSMAYKLFESINATALSLAPTDLIKNYILNSLQGNYEKFEIVEKGWKEMFEAFGEDGSRLKIYIRHHWIGTENYVNNSRLYDEVVKKYKESDEIFKYSRSLFELSKIYISLRESAIENLNNLSKKRNELKEIKEMLQFLSYLNVDQIYSVLLFIYNKEPKNFKKDLIKLMSFQFLYKYILGNPSIPEKKFANFCGGKTDRQKFFQELVKLCENQNLPFKDNFLEKIKYVHGRSGDVQYILEKYLYSMGGACAFNNPTIEHIVPQNKSDKIFKKFRNGSKDGTKCIHKIGNLTVLEGDDNSSGFNKAFREKFKLYKKNIFEGNKKIVSFPFLEDPEAAIVSRGGEIASAVYDIFLDALKTGKWKKSRR